MVGSGLLWELGSRYSLLGWAATFLFFPLFFFFLLACLACPCGDVLNAVCRFLFRVTVGYEPINEPCGFGCCHALFHSFPLLPGYSQGLPCCNYNIPRLSVTVNRVSIIFSRFSVSLPCGHHLPNCSHQGFDGHTPGGYTPRLGGLVSPPSTAKIKKTSEIYPLTSKRKYAILYLQRGRRHEKSRSILPCINRWAMRR